MGLFGRIKEGNHIILDTESDKYAPVKHLPKMIVSWDYRNGTHSGYHCKEPHRWDAQLRAWVCTHHIHHESRHREIVGDYQEWRAKHG